MQLLGHEGLPCLLLLVEVLLLLLLELHLHWACLHSFGELRNPTETKG